MQHVKLFLVITILFPISLSSQDELNLKRKVANEEVKRLTILTEKLESEKEELNNKLMIEYEKLLSQMDENSDLRSANGELREQIREMQKELLDFQKKIQEKKTEIDNFNAQILNYKSKIKSDSISIKNLNDSIIFTKNLSDSILNEKINLESNIYNKEMELYKKIEEEVLKENSVELLLYLEDGGIYFEGDE